MSRRLRLHAAIMRAGCASAWYPQALRRICITFYEVAQCRRKAVFSLANITRQEWNANRHPEHKRPVHLLTLPMRWGDMDAMGHVNNAVYFRYMESGRIASLDTLGCRPDPKGGRHRHRQCLLQFSAPARVSGGRRGANVGEQPGAVVPGCLDHHGPGAMRRSAFALPVAPPSSGSNFPGRNQRHFRTGCASSCRAEMSTARLLDPSCVVLQRLRQRLGRYAY